MFQQGVHLLLARLGARRIRDTAELAKAARELAVNLEADGADLRLPAEHVPVDLVLGPPQMLLDQSLL